MRQWFAANSPVDGEDLERHDKWLCMMWPRLHLLRELLAEDGVIFVSIDDNEQHHLRMLMDEVFGEANFIANIIWQHRHGRSNNAKLFSNQREHVMLYRKTESLTHIRVRRNKQLDATYTNPDNDPRGGWISSSYVNPATKEKRPNLVYSIINPHTESTVDHPTHAWKYSFSTYQQHVEENRLWWGKNRRMRYPRLKNFLTESKPKGIVPVDLMLADIAGTTDEGTRLLQMLFPTSATTFNNPKPVKLVKNLIEVAEGISPEEIIVLDSFAGSGTTAHAVLGLNKEDGGNRKFILVECEDYADSITAERVRRVIKGVPGARDQSLREGLGGEFTYCELGDEVTIEGMLNGELPSYSDIARMAIHNATGVAPDNMPVEFDGDLGFVYASDRTRYHLLYRADVEWLRGEEGALNSEKARRISGAATEAGKNAVVFAPARYMSQRDLTDLGITFCQLPYDLTTPRLKSPQS